MHHWLLLFLGLTVCAKVAIDTRGVDTPRGWRVDKSSGDVTASKAFDEGKTLQVDSFDSEEGITTKAVMSASDSIENIKTNTEKFNKLVAINVALRNALRERQDKTSFIRKHIKQLEVHVHTRISPLRAYEPPNDSRMWPKITVDLGDDNVFEEAKVIDGGVIVFRRTNTFDDDKPDEQLSKHSIAGIQRIVIELTDSQRFLGEFKESVGRKHCTTRGFLWLACRGSFRKEDTYYQEANKVIIDKVEMLVRVDDSDKDYKIFSAEPKVELSSAILQHEFVGFKQNPHWILHAYSSKDEGWQGDHDGSELSKKIWQRIESGEKISADVFREVIQCANQELSPILVTPQNPSLPFIEGTKWVKDKTFTPSKDADKCRPITAQSVADNASIAGIDETCLFKDSYNLDDLSEEELEEKREQLQGMVDKGEESNRGMKEDLDDLSKTGCFYDRKLKNGITVEIKGQYLVYAFGEYLTKEEFEKKYNTQLPPPETPLYINLGLDERSYPLTKNLYDNNGEINIAEALIDPDYTKNFSVRNIEFVHLSRGGNPEEMLEIVSLKRDARHTPNCFGGWNIVETLWNIGSSLLSDKCKQKSTQQKITVEYGIISIQNIALYHGDSGGKKFYQRTTNNIRKTNGIKSGLFILNSAVNSWGDYNIKNNPTWNERRKNACS